MNLLRYISHNRPGVPAGRFLPWAVLCLCLGGCAGLGGEFNLQTLHEGGLIIGGVTSRPDMLDGRERLAHAGRLENAFRDRYRSIEIVGAREVHDALGRSVYGQMLDSYRFQGTVAVVFTNALQQHWPSARYVAYARIEQDQVQRRHHPLPGGGGYELESIRALTVSMQVFDLFERPRQRVWAGALQDAATGKRRVFGDYAAEDLERLYPEPPPLSVVLDGVLERMAAYVGGDSK